jgi:hypothetical protein
MQPPFLLTQSRNLHMISCEKKTKLEVIPPYKIVVVHTYILIFSTHCPPLPVVRGEPVFSVMVAGWFCEKSG